MHPIVIIFLIFAALGGAYYLYTQQSDNLGGLAGSAQGKLGPYTHQIVLGVEIVVVLLVVYYIYGYLKSMTDQRASNKRLRDAYNERGPGR